MTNATADVPAMGVPRLRARSSWQIGQTPNRSTSVCGCWLAGDWANLLGLKTAEVLTPELVGRIVTVFATFPDWTAEQVYAYLQQQGCKVSHAQVAQASQESGWKRLIATLKERFDLQLGLNLRDEWLVAQLLSQIQLGNSGNWMWVDARSTRHSR